MNEWNYDESQIGDEDWGVIFQKQSAIFGMHNIVFGIFYFKIMIGNNFENGAVWWTFLSKTDL